MSEPEEVLAAMGTTAEALAEYSEHRHQLSLVDAVDAAIEVHIHQDDGESERHKSRVGVYHASSTPKCIRKRWYNAKNVKVQEHQKFPVGIGHRGDLTEEEVENALDEELYDVLTEELKNQLGDEITIGNEYPVSVEVDDWPAIGSFHLTGSTDPYVLNSDGELVDIVEVKSAQSVPDEPKWKHVVQLNTYLSVLGLKTGTLLYVNPLDWEDRRTFEIEQDGQLWEYTKLLNVVFHLYRRDDELPPALPIQENECQYCPYRLHCIRDSRADEWTEENFPPDQSVPSSQKTNAFKK